MNNPWFAIIVILSVLEVVIASKRDGLTIHRKVNVTETLLACIIEVWIVYMAINWAVDH